MEFDVNWLSVILATFSAFVVGAAWYSRPLLGNQWMKLSGVTEEMVKKGPGVRAWAQTGLAAFLQAFVLYNVIYLWDFYYTDNSWFSAAIIASLVMWAGFQLAVLLTHDSFEQRPIKLTLINAGNQLVTLLVMGVIIGLL